MVSAHMIFYLMPPLMILLVAGTVAQKEIGLYAATKLFFSGPVAWILMGVLTLCLTLKFLFDSHWSWQKAGIILSHLGVLILLYGGALTALTAKEGYIIIPEGEQSSTVLDYHQRALVLLKDGRIYKEWSHDTLKPGSHLTVNENTAIDIQDFCLNCDIIQREESLDNAFGMAAQVELKAKRPALNHEENISGVTFSIAGQRYILFEGFVKPLPVAGYELIYGKTQRQLPFRIQLKDFQKDVYVGTSMAKAYSSDVVVHDGEINWPAFIEMNKPLRYKGYTLFQSNYVERPDGPDSTILAVIENKGWIFPYIGTAIMALGLLWHFFARLSAGVKRKALIPFVSLLMIFASGTDAQANAIDFKAFSTLPVLHEGRLKTLDSFSRIYLERFAQKETIDGQPASVWLAELVFDPTRAALRPVFKVTHHELRKQLKVKDDEGRYFSLNRILPLLSETAPQLKVLMDLREEERSSGQVELLTLHEYALDFLQLMRSFSLVMPLDAEIPNDLKAEFEQDVAVRFIDLIRFENQIIERSKDIVRLKGSDWNTYNELESQYIALGFTQNMIREQNQGNKLFRVIPAANDQALWLSPWDIITTGQGSPKNKAILDHWTKLIEAYQTQDKKLWTEELAQLHALYKSEESIDPLKLKIEHWYKTWHVYEALLFGYVVSIALLMLFFSGKSVTAERFVLNLTLLSSLVACLFHAALILFRIYVLDRPPVGTLYESVIFVSWVTAFVGLLVDYKQKRGFALLGGVATALLLLIVAPVFVTDGESMDMLVAVLNTSFWLTTHVLCVTIGYALCIMAAMLGHIYLFRSCISKPQQGKLFTSMFVMSVAALFFTAFGTVLGGIWADQSWGRFWGWDPKENGALLIVLWLVWAMHGRHAGVMNTNIYAAAIAYLNVIVTLSWFGVNLLNVGLHSYGFINGIAYGILAVTGIETVIIGAALWRIHYLKKAKITHET